MLIETKFNQGDIVEEKNSGYKGKVTAVQTKMTGVPRVDLNSQSYLVVRIAKGGIPERRWIGAERLELIQQ